MEINWVKGHILDLQKRLVKDYGFTEEEALYYIKNYEKAPIDDVIREIMLEDGLTEVDIDDYFEVVKALENVEGLDIEIMDMVQSYEKRLVEIVLSTTTIIVVDIKRFIGCIKRIHMDVKDLRPSTKDIRAFYTMEKKGEDLFIVVDKELYGTAIERYDILKN